MLKQVAILFLLIFSPVICGGESKPLELSRDFLDYIMVCENGIRKGWYGYQQKWFPYDDGSGLHIAYGHKIKKGENFTDGITEQQAQSILRSDLREAYEKARVYFEHRGFCITDFSERQVEIVLDFTFNGCLYSHPKMMNAVATSDFATQRKEYKRYAVLHGKRVEIRDRNTRFFNRYLN